MQRLIHVILAAWAGSVWTTCGIVAPSLFKLLPDRHVAGEIAGHFFRIEAWLGLALGGLTLLLVSRQTSPKPSRLDYILILAAMFAPLASELLRPLMDAARTAGNMSQFGLFHGAAGILFLVACIALLM